MLNYRGLPSPGKPLFDPKEKVNEALTSCATSVGRFGRHVRICRDPEESSGDRADAQVQPLEAELHVLGAICVEWC